MQTILDKKNATQSNQSAEKLLLVLETLSVLDEPVRLQDLSRMLDMNASTVLRFLVPLQQRGYVAQDPESNRYFLTFKLCGLANNISSRLDLRNIALPFLRNVACIFQDAANLSIENDMSVMYLEVVNGPSKMLVTMQRIGHVAPMHCTGVGKILLLEYAPQKIEQLVAVKGLPRFTDHTITDREELVRELENIKKRGYSFDNEECEVGARCVAAPIRDYTGKIIAGISVNGPTTRMTDSHIHENLPYLLEAAEQISHRLGWQKSQES